MWSLKAVPSQAGQVVVVTGANGGLGLAAAKAFAGKGAHVVMAVRNQDKARAAREAILHAHPDASLELVALDLASQASVSRAAAQILTTHPVIDVLLNNAGIMAVREGRTEDGFERQFGVNHLGHWTLTAGLLPAILAAPQGRVVTVTSTAQHLGRGVDPDNPHLLGAYGPFKAYGQAKLANRHFAVGLHRLFDEVGVTARSLAAHPGLTDTDLQSRVAGSPRRGALARLAPRMLAAGMDTDRGALSYLRAATDPDAPGGAMYGPAFVTHGPPVRKPLVRPGTDRAIESLWATSERETGVAIDASTVAAAAARVA